MAGGGIVVDGGVRNSRMGIGREEYFTDVVGLKCSGI
jgi:hypothetical protein